MCRFMNKEMIMKWNRIFGCLAIGAMFWACSDSDDKDVVGGASGDSGITAVTDWEVAGVSQKGPFVTGSAVTVQELDGITLKQTGKSFKGSIKSDKGDFAIKDINLESQYAILEATGYYRDEVSGKKSSGTVTLRALTDLSNRKTVNINLLTHLEYERVMYLVNKKKMSIADAKAQAEEEVLASFGIEGDFGESEDLNIFKSGDGNAALLAVSVLLQGDVDVAGLTERMGEFSISLAEGGSWDDADTKTAIADWACDVDLKGSLSKVRKNVEGWKYADTVPAFEKYVTNFWWDNYGLGVCNDKRENETKRNINKLSKLYNEYFVCEKGRWHIPGDEPVSSSSKGGSSSSKPTESSSSSKDVEPAESSSSSKDVEPAETSSSSAKEESSSSVASSSSVTNPFISSSSRPETHDTIPELSGDLAFLETFFNEYKSYVTFENEKQKNWIVSREKYDSTRVRDSALIALGDTLTAQGFEYAGRMLIDDALCLQEGDSSYVYVKNAGKLAYKIYVTKKSYLVYSVLGGAYVSGYGYEMKIVALEKGMEEHLTVNCKSLEYEKELPEEVRFIGEYGYNVHNVEWNDDSLTTFWFMQQDVFSCRDSVVATCEAEGKIDAEESRDSLVNILIENDFALTAKDSIEIYHYYGTYGVYTGDGLYHREIYEKETGIAKYRVITYSVVSYRGDVFNHWYMYENVYEIHTYYKNKPE